MRTPVLLLAVAGFAVAFAGCSSTPPKDVFEEEEIKALQGELAGSVEYKTSIQLLLDKGKWSGGEKESHTFSLPMDWGEMDKDLSSMVRKFGLFKELVELEGATPDRTEEEILALAREEEVDLVVLFNPVKTEIRYEGRNFFLWLTDLLIWTFLWFPAYIIPDEEYSANVGLEMRVLDAFSGRELYKKTFEGSESRTFDDFGRGFGFLDIWSPLLAQWTVGERNFRKVSESLMPHAMTRVKKDLLKDLAVEFRASLQTPEVRNRITPKTRRLFSVIVGAGAPGGTKRARARYTEADAEALWKWVRGSKEPALDLEGSSIITGESATAAAIRDAIDRVKARYPRPDEDVLFFFSGLGAVALGAKGPEPFLVTADTDTSRIEETALPLSEVVRNLEALGVERVSLIIDAGFTKRRRGRSIGRSSKASGSPVYPTPPAGKERTWFVVLAGQEGKRVLEIREFGHGLMTKFFLEAVEGKADANGDGTTSLGEITDYLKQHLPVISGMVSTPQRPWTRVGEPARALIPGPATKEEPAEEPAEGPSEEPGEKPAEEPDESPSEEPGDEPAEEEGEKPGEEPSETPDEGTEEGS